LPKYLSIPAGNTFKIHPDVSDDVASILDPLGNAAHTALSFDLVGEDVVITGAGPIGVMSAALCKHVGARFVVVTDLNDYRLELAEKLGATRSVNVSREKLKEVQKELGMKEGFDIGLEMSGSVAAFADMLDNMNHGGKISFLGIPAEEQMTLNIHQIIFKGLTIKGIYGREMFETWYKMAAMLTSGLDISQVITHHYGVDDFIEAFETMNTGQTGKVILSW
jgi:threonine 3-dehydrogenase